VPHLANVILDCMDQRTGTRLGIYLKRIGEDQFVRTRFDQLPKPSINPGPMCRARSRPRLSIFSKWDHHIILSHSNFGFAKASPLAGLAAALLVLSSKVGKLSRLRVVRAYLIRGEFAVARRLAVPPIRNLVHSKTLETGLSD
jgi:hypothetical protein